MAVGRVRRRVVRAGQILPELPAPEPVMVQMPKEKKGMGEKMFPVIMVLLLIMAFALGAMWSKIKYLESGATQRPAPAGQAGQAPAVNSKYKNFGEAMGAYAKELGIDGKKLVQCVSSGEKNKLVDADAQEGAGLGVQGTPGFFVNGRFVGGAFPYEAFKEIVDRELAGTASTDPKTYSQILQGAGAAFDPKPKNVPVGNGPVRGEAEAKVTVVEYSDFQCPFCSRSKPTMDQLLSEYSGKVKLVYKHFPLDQIHPNARIAAQASECARDQGKFWEMHDVLFDRQQEWAQAPQG